MRDAAVSGDVIEVSLEDSCYFIESWMYNIMTVETEGAIMFIDRYLIDGNDIISGKNSIVMSSWVSVSSDADVFIECISYLVEKYKRSEGPCTIEAILDEEAHRKVNLDERMKRLRDILLL